MIARRLFSTSTSSYPFPLFWIKGPKAVGLSLLKPSLLPNASVIRADDPRLIGWFQPAAASTTSQPLPTVTNFTPNQKFEDLLHKVLKEKIHLDDGWKAMAQNQKEGYLNISDVRVFTPWGRVSDPEDLFGAVLLKEGVIVENSYQKMGTHRLVSGNGLFQVSELLHEKLVKELENVQ
ncbi:hypothetical protein BDR26DRAFT_135277 [Obelidium mucronatum]|nr:hypothetical protein BDR26DRAFT_135277 [Obelidium mucronatum]